MTESGEKKGGAARSRQSDWVQSLPGTTAVTGNQADKSMKQTEVRGQRIKKERRPGDRICRRGCCTNEPVPPYLMARVRVRVRGRSRSQGRRGERTTVLCCVGLFLGCGVAEWTGWDGTEQNRTGQGGRGARKRGGRWTTGGQFLGGVLVGAVARPRCRCKRRCCSGPALLCIHYPCLLGWSLLSLGSLARKDLA